MDEIIASLFAGRGGGLLEWLAGMLTAGQPRVEADMVVYVHSRILCGGKRLAHRNDL